MTYRSKADTARAVVKDIERAGGVGEAVPLDLTDATAVDRLVTDLRDRYGRVGHVVYAAGPAFRFNYIGAIPDDDWHRVLDTDVNGAFHLVQAAVRTFRAQGPAGTWPR